MAMPDVTRKQDAHGKLGFRRGDIVWTPMRRKAALTEFRDDGRWNAIYQGEGPHTGRTILDPKHLTMVDDE